MKFPSDEVWGPRYLHLAVAPLLVCLGAAWPGFEWRRDIFLVSLAVTGVAISFLGAFYYYGEWSRAMRDADQNTMEWIVGDNAWNPVTFDARVFRVWLEGGDTPVPWTNAHLWVWEPPPGAAPWRASASRAHCVGPDRV